MKVGINIYVKYEHIFIPPFNCTFCSDLCIFRIRKDLIVVVTRTMTWRHPWQRHSSTVMTSLRTIMDQDRDITVSVYHHHPSQYQYDPRCFKTSKLSILFTEVGLLNWSKLALTLWVTSTNDLTTSKRFQMFF